MPAETKTIQGPKLLKVWDNWEGGVGSPTDDGTTTALYSASGILGLRGELRPAPHTFTTSVAVTAITHFQYFFEALDSAGAPYLYALQNERTGTASRVVKFDLRNAGFGASLGTSRSVSTGGQISHYGQPAEYEGLWFVPFSESSATSSFIEELTTVGTGTAGNDSWNARSPDATHLFSSNFQLIRVTDGLRTTGSDGPGISILKIDGTVSTASDWGEFFPVGEKNQAFLGLAELAGSNFVLKKDGLYTFNTAGRSARVFADFKKWGNVFGSLPLEEWRTGLVISHPSALLWYRPGFIPIDIGITNQQALSSIPSSLAPDFQGGRYHSSISLGNTLYCIYQPDTTSTTAYILAGSSVSPTSFLPISWQVLGSLTLDHQDFRAGIGVATRGLPIDDTVARPSLWFSNADDVSYIILSSSGTPLRPRVDTHRVRVSGDAYHAEIFFPTPTDLSYLIIYTQDMTSGDKWQLSGITDNSVDRNYGGSVSTNGRIKIKANQRSVSRLMLHVNWTATSTSNRVPPVIKRIELYGQPS